MYKVVGALLVILGVWFAGLYASLSVTQQVAITKATLAQQANSFALDAEQTKDDFINTHRAFIFKVVNEEGNSGGTGFLVRAPSGKVYLMTNEHVCSISTNEKVYISNGAITIYTTINARYTQHDLCLVDMPMMAGLAVAPSVRDAQNIYIIGHPLLQPLTTVKGQLAGELAITVLQGFDLGDKCKGEGYFEEGLLRHHEIATLMPVKGAQFGFFFGKPCLRRLNANPVTATIHPGNSGSPVLDGAGRVVGVAFAGGARSYIIPLRYVKAFLEGK